MSSKFSRKKLFVNSFAQGRTVAHVAFYWGVYHLILWHVMFLYRYCQYRGELAAGAAPRTFNDLYSEFTLTHFSMLVCGLAILPLVIWDVIKFTHRIVGPLVRLKDCLAKLSRGETIPELRFRKGDLLVDVQDAFNQFLQSPYCHGQHARRAIEAEGAESAPVDDLTAIGNDVREIQASLKQQIVPADDLPVDDVAGTSAPGSATVSAAV